MNYDLYNKITIVIVLYEENLQLISQCLENIKNFDIIIIDKKKYKKNTIFQNIYSTQKMLVIQERLTKVLNYVLTSMFLFFKLIA